jgi:cell division protein FtsZ
MGTGRATGAARASEAAQSAVSSPLLEDVSISGAEGVLVNITGGRDLTLHEVNEAASVVVNAAGEEANVIFGAVIDPNMDGELMITVIATGFGHIEPRLRLIDRSQRPAAEPPADADAGDEYRHPQQPWKREEAKRTWTRSREESMEVPAFLRRQAD